MGAAFWETEAYREKAATSKTHDLRGNYPVVAVTPAGTIPRGEEADVANVTADRKKYWAWWQKTS